MRIFGAVTGSLLFFVSMMVALTANTVEFVAYSLMSMLIGFMLMMLCMFFPVWEN